MEPVSRYPKEHYDTKAKRYSRTIRVLFGVHADDTTTGRWSDLIRLARDVDDFLDNGDRPGLAGRVALVERLMQEPGDMARFYSRLTAEKLGAEKYRKVQNLGIAVVRASYETKQAENVSRYAVARRAEGNLYAQLICAAATPETSIQRGFGVFARWLQPLGEVVSLGNSITDIHDDYAHGELSFRPNHLTRLQLLGHIAHVIVDAAQGKASAAV